MTHWFAETLVATTLLMALVLLVRPLISARFGARAAYLLWAAPAARMVLPPLPAGWAPAELAPVRDAVVILAGPSSQPVQAAAVTGGGVAWATVLTVLWLGGAALFFARHWIAYAAFELDVRGGGESAGEVDGIPITQSGAVTSPIALGVFGRRVIVPADFAHRFDRREQRLALAHELVHHRRFDVAANFFALAMLALHWWNPVAHLAHRAFRIDQEAACDDIVLSGADADDRYAYGTALFKSAMGRVPLAACAMGVTSTLKARLARIVGTAHAAPVRHGLPITAALVAGGVALTASAAAIEPVILVEPAPVIAFSAPVPEPASAPMEAPLAPRAKAVPKSRVATVSAVASVPAIAPFAPSAPLALPVSPIPVAPPAPVAQAVPAALACGHDGVQMAIRVSADGAEHRSTRIIVCGVRRQVESARMIEAIRSARVKIAAMETVEEAQRAHALASLERQLASLEAAAMPHFDTH